MAPTLFAHRFPRAVEINIMQMHVNVWTEQTNRQKEKRTSRLTNKPKASKVASLAISHVLGSDCHEQVGQETLLGFPTKWTWISRKNGLVIMIRGSLLQTERQTRMQKEPLKLTQELWQEDKHKWEEKKLFATHSRSVAETKSKQDSIHTSRAVRHSAFYNQLQGHHELSGKSDENKSF